MNLIDRLFQKLGYVRIMKEIPIKKENFNLELVQMKYEINHSVFVNASNPTLQIAIEHEMQLNKFIRLLAPFVERRQYQKYPLRVNQSDGQVYELRIYVAKPPRSS